MTGHMDFSRQLGVKSRHMSIAGDGMDAGSGLVGRVLGMFNNGHRGNSPHTAQQTGLRAEYENNGFTVVRGLGSPDAIAAVRSALEQEVYASEGSFLRHPSVTREPHVWMTTSGGGRRVKNALFNPHLQPEARATGQAILDLICTSPFGDVLAQIDGDDRHTITQIILFFVSPGTEVHIDGWSMDTERPGGTYTAWIALETVTTENGPVGIFPWKRSDFLSPSQFGIPLDAADLRDAYFAYSSKLVQTVRDRSIDCVVPMLNAGDAAVFSAITPHVSLPPRLHDVTRMALQVVIRPASARWGGNLLSRMRGEITRDNPASLRRVNDRWFALLNAAS